MCICLCAGGWRGGVDAVSQIQVEWTHTWPAKKISLIFNSSFITIKHTDTQNKSSGFCINIIIVQNISIREQHVGKK